MSGEGGRGKRKKERINMSRLGDLIRTERIRQKLSPKQVAKKCGVSESYLLAVEAGTKIIADDQARRILKTIGLKQQTEAEFTLDDIAATVAKVFHLTVPQSWRGIPIDVFDE